MPQQSFNINHHVRVKLTEFGIMRLRDYHDEMRERLGNWTDIGEFERPKVDGEGYTKFQLWDLMHKLGSHLSMCSELLFDTDILLEPEEFSHPLPKAAALIEL